MNTDVEAVMEAVLSSDCVTDDTQFKLDDLKAKFKAEDSALSSALSQSRKSEIVLLERLTEIEKSEAVIKYRVNVESETQEYLIKNKLKLDDAQKNSLNSLNELEITFIQKSFDSLRAFKLKNFNEMYIVCRVFTL